MNRKWTIGQQIALGFALPIVVLIVLGAISYQGAQKFMDASRSVTSGYEQRSRFDVFQVDSVEAESSQRAFLLTGRESDLEPYHATLAAGENKYRELRSYADDPAQLHVLETLYAAYRERLDLLGKGIELRRRDGLEAAAKAVAEEQSHAVNASIRTNTDAVKKFEEDDIKATLQSFQGASDRLTTILWSGTGGTVLLALVAGYLMIRGLDRQIGTAVQHMQSASAELQAAASQQSKGAKGQVAASTEVSTTIQELVSTSRQIADSAQQVTQVAGSTASAARSGDEVLRSAQEAIDAVRRQVDRIVAHMLDLGKKSQEIGGILEIINELAEQTNILSINATIEAVGAGEAGRRFTVVADEIRKLADRVGGSTKEIRNLIEDIRAAANTTVLATEDGSKAVDAGSRRFGEVASSFKRITEYVDSTAQASREIELSTKQQRTAVEQVNLAMNDVSQAARDTEASSGQTLRTAAELASLSQELVRLVRRDAVA